MPLNFYGMGEAYSFPVRTILVFIFELLAFEADFNTLSKFGGIDNVY